MNWKKLIISILLAQFAGIFGSFFTAPAIGGWYATLNKPGITPPNWLFGPMWITLYTLMGIAFYLIWEKGFKKEDNKIAGVLYGVQLVLNALWSWIFFGLHSLVGGLIEIIFLWFFILATIIEFRGIDRKAGWVMLPYLAWVTAALVLNFSLAWLN